jgi:hypothetical protein
MASGSFGYRRLGSVKMEIESAESFGEMTGKEVAVNGSSRRSKESIVGQVACGCEDRDISL